MRIVVRVVAALVLLCCAVSARQEQKPPAAADYKIPPDASKLPNPVKPTAASLAAGKKIVRL